MPINVSLEAGAGPSANNLTAGPGITISGTAVSASFGIPKGVPQLGSDGTIGGPGGTALSSSVVTDSYLQGSPVLSTGYAAAIEATAGLVSYWQLGESTGTTAHDSFGSNPGTYEGGVTLGEPGPLTDGSGATAVLLNGTSGYITVPSAAGLQFTNAFSFEAWLYPLTNYANYGVILSKNLSTDYEWRIHPASGLPQLTGGNFSGGTISGDTPVPLNEPVFLAVIYDGAHATFYINGAEDVAQSFTGSASTSATALGIGARANASIFLPATLSQVAVYNTKLSAATILAHFQARLTAQLAVDAVAGTASLRSTGRNPQQAMPGNMVAVIDESVVVTDPYLTSDPADPTGNNYSDTAFAAAIAKALTSYTNGYGPGMVTGPSGRYMLENQLGVPAGVALGNFGGGVKGAAELYFPSQTGYSWATGITNANTTAGQTTLPLVDVRGTFNPAGGTAVFQYVLITYTGTSGVSGTNATLTGCTGIPALGGSGQGCFGNFMVMGTGKNYEYLDKTIAVQGPNSSLGTIGPTAPTNVMDGIYVPSSGRVDCQCSGFRHLYNLFGDHEWFGRHTGGGNCYSIFCFGAPTYTAGWTNVDSGNQEWEDGGIWTGAGWASVYVTAYTGIVFAQFGVGHWGFAPWWIFCESAGSNRGGIADITVQSPAWESIGLGIIGTGDTVNGAGSPTSVLTDIYITNPSQTVGSPPAGYTQQGSFCAGIIENIQIVNPDRGFQVNFYANAVSGRITGTSPGQGNPFPATPVTSPSGLTPPVVNIAFDGGALVSGTANSINSGDLVQVEGVTSSPGIGGFGPQLQYQQYDSATAPVAGIALAAEANYVVPIATSSTAGSVEVNAQGSGAITSGGIVYASGTGHPGKATTTSGSGPAFGVALANDSSGQAPVAIVPAMR